MFIAGFSSNIFLIIWGLIQLSYQQNTKDETTNKDLTFCIENHSLSNNLQTFWHDATSDCEMAPRRLMELYTQLKDRSAGKDDQCSALLEHKMRKKLADVVAEQLEEAFVTQSFNNNRELKLILKELLDIDERVSQAIWQRALNEIFMFLDSEKIIEVLMQSKLEEIQAFGLQYLLNKYQMGTVQNNEKFLSLFVHSVSKLLKSKTLDDRSFKLLNRIFNRLPQELRVLHDTTNQFQIGLLNIGHWEYLYAPRDNGPDAERRTPLTWSQDKNSTDSDGHFLKEFNSEGLIAFGSRFGASTKYLYADTENHAAFFWIGAGSKSSQWWNVIWPHDLFTNQVNSYLIFENYETKDLLCATREYDENRRYVTLLNGRDNMENVACHWKVTKI